MRQHLSFRKHFRRGNAAPIQIAALHPFCDSPMMHGFCWGNGLRTVGFLVPKHFIARFR